MGKRIAESTERDQQTEGDWILFEYTPKYVIVQIAEDVR